MGATLTLLIRHLVRSDVEAQGRRIALLYAVNTAGAAVGCFLTDFTLVPAWGLRNTQLIAVALNMIAGSARFVWSAGRPSAAHPQVPPEERRRPKPSPQPESVQLSGGGLHQPRARAVRLRGARDGDPLVPALLDHAGAFRAVFSLLLTVILVGIGAGALVAGVVQRRTRRPANADRDQALFVVVTLMGWRAPTRV
jgi:hypothetical protein